ncbi:efflux RND transporter periplasmic adaptor subunit [Pseudomonas sp. 13B_2.1_Bac1]|uniref:efflux RND transporter periplasmic adaptor subunit n=1 Tax=Pseudomonas sp. 13B_2.1_Bac1 TaxID=2971624 RepID=UPI0021C5B81A|nr:efflux RND transporter periplasmic adaptor subunit [Pseudomonas sp. 13B_2.1_Bac1]MCU1785298.1 efflux RND transporter periplasmic adaptor subunit [Pseudomonas sp. 13B_2.1_Bac1]
MSTSRRWQVVPVLPLLAALSLAGCEQPPQGWGGPGGPREVEAMTVSSEPLTLIAQLPGRVEPVRVAEVRARVAGIVLARHFEEGTDVKAGDLLFQIDPAPFKAALSRAQGELAKTDAALFQAQTTVKRYEPLVKIEAVSQQDFDTAKAALQSALAAKRSAQADVETANLNLSYSTVKAPIAGRIGRALVTEGALVGQGDATMMARIQQLDPIYVDFTQPAADALRMRAAIEQGRLTGNAETPLTLSVEGSEHRSQGELLFSDVAVDRATGQISLRGRFANPGTALLPGMYVRVSAPQGLDKAAILIPQRAVQRSADGQARVLVIGQDQTIEAKPVNTGAMQGSRWQITKGLVVGDQIVTGAMNGINPGDKVIAKSLTTQQAKVQ